MGLDAAGYHPVWSRQAVDRCSDIPMGIAAFLQLGEIAVAFPVVIVDAMTSLNRGGGGQMLS